MPVKTDTTSVMLQGSVHSDLCDPVSHRLSNPEKFKTLNCKCGDNTCISLTMQSNSFALMAVWCSEARTQQGKDSVQELPGHQSEVCSCGEEI